MFNWSYLIPRFVVLAAVAAFIHFGLDPLIRWGLVYSGESVVGAKIDVAKVETSLFNGTAQLENVAVTNPSSPKRNLFEFDSAVLHVDKRAFWDRRYVINNGEIQGLRVDTIRDRDGTLERPDREPDDSDHGQLAEKAQEWFNEFSGKFTQDLEEDLESVRLANELKVRWPREYEKIETRIHQWKERVARLRGLYDRIQANPLQELTAYQQALEELTTIRHEIPQIRAEFDRLHQQVDRDQQAIRIAKDNDIAYVRERLRMDQMDPQNLTEYLLGEQISNHLTTLSGWIQRGRTTMQSVKLEPEINSKAGRGVNVSFLVGPPQPSLLIRSLRLTGTVPLDDKAVAYEGIVQGLTSEPKLYGKPVMAKFAFQGDSDIELYAQIDQTSDEPTERLLVRSPNLVQPNRSLGDKNQVAIDLSPGAANVWFEVALRNDEIIGQLHWQQERVTLTPTVADSCGGEQVGQRLQAALTNVNKINAKVDVSGTLSSPKFHIESNLGSQLNLALNDAIRSELKARTDQFAGQADQFLNKQIADLDGQFAKQKEQLLSQLQVGDDQLGQLSAQFKKIFDVGAILGQKPFSVQGLFSR